MLESSNDVYEMRFGTNWINLIKKKVLKEVKSFDHPEVRIRKPHPGLVISQQVEIK